MASDRHQKVALHIAAEFVVTGGPAHRRLTLAIRKALTRAERDGMRRAAEIAAGWPVNAAGDDYQFDGNQYWDAGNVYDQGRLDASQCILSQAGEDAQ